MASGGNRFVTGRERGALTVICGPAIEMSPIVEIAPEKVWGKRNIKFKGGKEVLNSRGREMSDSKEKEIYIVQHQPRALHQKYT